MATKKPTRATKAGLKHGYRSGLEVKVQKQFDERGLNSNYESDIIVYRKPPSKYHPDFKLPSGVYVETKGRWLGSDRSKHLLIKKQHPDIEIRFVFNNPNAKLSKTSKTTYGQWCDKYGFKYSKGEIPGAWFDEKD